MAKEYIEGFAHKKFGLIGEKLGHSFSPQIHKAFADYPYSLCEVERNSLGEFMKENTLSGFNVTIPYKQDVMKYCAEISQRARRIGAVNTVVRRSDGTYFGDNTDYDGFSYMLSEISVDVKGKKVVVLGSGGASKTVQTVLGELGADVVVVSRNGENNYENIANHKDAALLVNATPVGMYPNTSEVPADLSVFECLEGVCDLIYNPLRTALLVQAESMGIKTVNGLSMLVSQAKRACEIFTGESLSDRVIKTITKEMTEDTENIALIGMPGCGKSSVGKYIAQKLHRDFVDTDEEIVKYAKRTPSEIIRSDGEAEFRKIETQVLENVAKEKGRIIATGGGIVTVDENKGILRRNSKIIYIERDLSLLATEDRPLSTDLEKLFTVREPLYKSFADVMINGSGSVEEVGERIISEVLK
ncbi:MAG: shikimate kinase [Eubacteriales bacterium]|nr:shikimate kinase [Eubacteriales bacterium]